MVGRDEACVVVSGVQHRSHDNALARLWLGTALLGALIGLTKHSFEGLGDVGIVPGADFDPSGLELRSELFAFCLGDLSLNVKIALLTDNDARDRLGASVIENLVVNGLDHVEAIARGDAVDEHVTVDADGVFGVEDRIFILTGSVDDVAVVFLTLVGDGLLEDVLDGRVVRVDESVLNVSDDQRRFACVLTRTFTVFVAEREEQVEE